ncbi:hypothetical protein D3C81_1680050 [compost metagenome]
MLKDIKLQPCVNPPFSFEDKLSSFCLLSVPCLGTHPQSLTRSCGAIFMSLGSTHSSTRSSSARSLK